MKSIHRFLGITALTMVILLIAAIAAGTVYISSHKNVLNELGHFNIFNGLNGDFNFSLKGERSSTFETIKTSKSDVFPLPNAIVLDIAVDHIIFIEEDREDIAVEYYNEHPNSTHYNTTYSAQEVDKTLYVNSTYSVSNLFIDQTYDSYIKLHVPKTYECETLDLTMSLGDINDESIFDGPKNLILHSNLGSIHLEITSPMDTLSVTCDMGDIDLTTKAPIKTFDTKAAFGKINLNLKDTVGTLWSELDMGSLTIDSNATIESIHMSAKMGSIDGNFVAHVGKLTANANMGSIDASFENNEDSTAFADANAGSIESDIKIVKESADPDFKFYANMGSIHISSN